MYSNWSISEETSQHGFYSCKFLIFFLVLLCYICSVHWQQSTCTLQDLVTSQMGNNPSGQTDLVVFCSGGFEDLDPAKSEG